ncbi:hypothetical protein NUH86_15685 [Sphingobium sp. JS3065]|uniref:hypothetical protein n=1 Tax=Sphingobium sp. JS3065 TaxID=2970925 RepID=UPI0022649A5A|nr:hypothetical protein [Sphingobium sp. JS3065]UZW54896.1 hypothetical protein NUH86_15685 [Sphingobium sp. JS3065]
MGHGNWSARDWEAYAARSVHGRGRSELFGARGMDASYDPARIEMRESRDSADNPDSTPIIIGVDVTGSMGMLAEELVVHGLNETFTMLMDRRPVSDPHVMAMAIGDAYCDRAPLQVTQFEADLRIVEQLRQLWLEGGGGGNEGESYCLAHVFAGLKTEHDAMEKRRRKGFLFTVGDEPVLDGVERDQLARVLGIDAQRGVSGREAVKLASAGYEVFHIIVDGSYAARNMRKVRASWEAILPERVIHLKDPARLAETIVATIELASGRPATAPSSLATLLPEPLRRLRWAGLGRI